MKTTLPNRLRRRATMLLVTLAAVTLTTWAQTQPATGDGSVDNPYLISNAQEMLWFQQHVNEGTERANAAACAKLTADIDLSTICGEGIGSWTSIANENAGYSSSTGYKGTFDGDGHRIDGLFSNTRGNNAFIQFISKGSMVKNLTVNAQIKISGSSYCAAIASSGSGGTISRCTSEGNISGTMGIGGIAGLMATGNIEYCLNRAVITNNSERAGGIVGSVNGTNILYCRNEGTVTSTSTYVGGIAGLFQGSSTAKIQNCVNTAAITGKDVTGGIVGRLYTGSISDSYSTGNVTVTNLSDTNPATVGAIVGKNENGTIANCYYPDTVTLMKGGNAAMLVGVGNGNSEEGTTVKTPEQFASGEVAFLLGNKAWGQAIGTDPLPAFLLADNSNKVYTYTHEGQTCYTNNAALDGTDTHHNYGTTTGICSLCGEPQPATLVEEVYEIGNAGQMLWFANHVNTGTDRANAAACAKLTTDIDLSPVCGEGIGNWTPIANQAAGYNSASGYEGTFDGAGHTLSGLYINSSENNLGLFAYINTAGVVKNLTVDADITGINAIGSISADMKGTVSRCTAKGSITGKGYVGGIVEKVTKGTIEHCVNLADVKITSYSGVGGIVSICMGTIRSCRNEGTVTNAGTNTNGNEVGGITGRTDIGSQIIDCVNHADIIGKGSTGGIAGEHNKGSITNCYSTGNITATSGIQYPASAGAIVGKNVDNQTITNCYYPETVTLTNDGVAATLAGVGTGDGEAGTIAKTAEEFTSGEVAYLLGNEVWGQVIGTDPLPVFLTDDNAVYKVSFIVNGEQPSHTEYVNAGIYTPTYIPEGNKGAEWGENPEGTPSESFNVTADLTLYFLGDPTGISRMESDGLFHEITNIYSVDGRLVKTVPAAEYSNRLNGLERGIYIVNGRKEAVK